MLEQVSLDEDRQIADGRRTVHDLGDAEDDGDRVELADTEHPGEGGSRDRREDCGSGEVRGDHQGALGVPVRELL
ncbi:hypothetical protein [Streptomyces sp. NPDC085665]|uniref:hypothetical protein n=1 Tax=Streptomyces sp. NPDC085665 TaxID=3365735 RepID=UPI0037D05CF9